MSDNGSSEDRQQPVGFQTAEVLGLFHHVPSCLPPSSGAIENMMGTVRRASKSAASRRFVALSAERLAEWMVSDLSKLDLLIIQIDGLHIGNDLVLVGRPRHRRERR